MNKKRKKPSIIICDPVAGQSLDILIEPEYENPLGLAVVQLKKVFPHEHIDPRRVENLNELPLITMVKSDLNTVQAEMVEHGGLCYIQTVDKTIYCIQPKPEVNHLDALNELTAIYIKAGHVSRTLHDDIDILLNEFPDLTGVVVFPVFTLEQVLQIIEAGNVMPAGITRSLISGRVMRLNADFEYLKSDRDIDEKNKWLYDLVMEKLSKDQTRYYAEPIYLMDE